MLELYKNIKKFRKERGFSQEELARRTGYSDRSSIAKIEKGDVDLPQSKIVIFAKALAVSPGELMGDVEKDDSIQTDIRHKWYNNPEALAEAQEFFDNPDLHALMDAARDCRPEYIKSAVQLLITLKETNPDG